MAYLGGPKRWRPGRAQPLVLHDPPPGGFAPTPRKLRHTTEKQRVQRRRDTRRLRIVSRVVPVILALLVVATVVIVLVAAA